MKVVVVESPAKAKTINRYLGDDYHVLASYGHVRDLPSKDGSVNTEADFDMVWQSSDSGAKRMKEIDAAMRNADKLILATDPDREGEAISWHVIEMLKDKPAMREKPYERVVFNEITKSAILHAIENPRQLDNDLIDAYLARRALDHLIGFSLSPVLWRKLPGSRSAGRVQSVALKLICQREAEIEAFISDEFWTVDTDFTTADGRQLTARLTHLDDIKLDKLALSDEQRAKAAESRIQQANFAVSDIETKRVKRRPAPPFTTSTLQQEASRKLGFSASKTMQIAQKLYEGINIGSETTGLITYMRTDGVQMSKEAIFSIRDEISESYGASFVPDSPRMYKSKAANAQEAHEAIRPTAITRTPEKINSFLDYDQQRLYELIYKRTLASQMADAALDQTAIDISASDDKIIMRATGSVVVFDGFMKAYKEDFDDQPSKSEQMDENSGRLLPAMTKAEAVQVNQIQPEQHFTQPPARFTDASLVKKLEELGIGRPSTYASIMQVIEKRGYVSRDRKRFIPEHRGRIVSAFLENFFAKYVENGFTAQLEGQLDEVSAGQMAWRDLLREFWHPFSKSVAEAMDLSVPEVMDTLDKELEQLFFKPDETGQINRTCTKCNEGRLEFKLGKFGPFLGCSNYPECKFTRQVSTASEEDGDEQLDENKLLGKDPQTEMEIWLKRGPYGHYVQQGDDDTKRPKRSAIPKGVAIADVTLDYALGLLSLPRDIGLHPESKEMIQSGLGRYGPYLKYQGKFVSLKDGDDVLSVGINRAVDILAEAAKTAGRVLGAHPDGGDIELKKGRFGPYVEHNKLRAPVPRGTEMAEISLEQAIEWLAAKAAKPAKKKPAKKSAAKKKATKRKAAKSKTAQSNPASKKSTSA